ncbi:barstar family protein [Neisseria chenwenguii]|uniref:barstar family protein n=1 Tax=Neisseria chenwenguii TaxID=1853278 RepID=UPI000F516BD5|nr:barstar family protein [Neisseria chenwenguii]ROV52399.1 barnase inhibitor [Neisseria chenwenguii]
MVIYIDGNFVSKEIEFHEQLAHQLGITSYYGNNLDALWDLLSISIERPLTLVWFNSEKSKEFLGEDFEKIVRILERVKQQDISYNWEEKFTYYLN